MPLVMQTSPIAPNSIYFPQIIIQTGIVNGDLKTSCQLVLSAANVTVDGETGAQTWVATGQTQTIFLSDIANLEEDLVSLTPNIAQLYGQIVGLVDGYNAIRKVL